MSDFLESLVLRAAGLPLTASPAPRQEVAFEEEAPPIEIAEEEQPPIAAAQPSIEAAPQQIEPPSVFEREVIREETHEVQREQLLRESHEVAAQPVLIPAPEPLQAEPTPQTTIIEEHHQHPERAIETHVIEERPQLIAQPTPSPIEVPRETLVERDHETTTRIEEKTTESPLLLQPIVIDKTRTIVEPTREETTIIETRTDHTAHERESIETQRELLQTTIDPRITERIEQTIETHEVPPNPAQPDQQPPRETATPRTLIVPPPPIAQPPTPEHDERSESSNIQIHIGTIEIRAAVPPPPPAPAPPQIIQQRAPEPPPNFDDYAAVRNYIFPDVWR